MSHWSFIAHFQRKLWQQHFQTKSSHLYSESTCVRDTVQHYKFRWLISAYIYFFTSFLNYVIENRCVDGWCKDRTRIGEKRKHRKVVWIKETMNSMCRVFPSSNTHARQYGLALGTYRFSLCFIRIYVLLIWHRQAAAPILSMFRRRTIGIRATKSNSNNIQIKMSTHFTTAVRKGKYKQTLERNLEKTFPSHLLCLFVCSRYCVLRFYQITKCVSTNCHKHSMFIQSGKIGWI